MTSVRKRRIIYNEEGIPSRGYADVPAYLNDRLTPLAGSHVDTLFWCVGQHLLRYPTAITDYDLFPQERKWIQAGQDPFQMVIDFSRAQGLEIFATLRMNDTHDATMDESAAYRIKRKHPEWLVGEKPAFKPDSLEGNALGLRGYVDCLDTAGWYYSALDYGVEDVRNRFFAVVEEVCRRYDIDGMELDFLTHPMFFKPCLHGRTAEAEQIALMTGFIRRVRNRMIEVASNRGRRLELAVRVPRTVEQGLFLGLDVEAWVKERLIDILVPGGRCCPFTIPVADWVRVAHGYDVAVYPSQGGFSSPESSRAQAMYAWENGADGIYLFNYFVGGFDKIGQQRMEAVRTLHEIGDPAAIACKDKVYAVTPGGKERRWAAFRHVSQRYLPAELDPDKGQPTCLMPLMVADKVPSPKVHTFRLELEFTGMADRDDIRLQLNGTGLTASTASREPLGDPFHVRLTCAVSAPPLVRGENKLTVTLMHRDHTLSTIRRPLVLDQVRLWVRHEKP